MAKKDQSKDPFLAGVLSFIVPGAGQMYSGEVGRGIAFLVGASFGYVIFFAIGIGLHIWAVIDANELIKRKNNHVESEEKRRKEEKNMKTTSSEFVESVTKTHMLYENEILSEEEYVNKKKSLISELHQKNIKEDPDDFLSSIIVLKDEDMLNQDEIKKIKLILY